jgi:hypothetical protein
VKVACEGNDPNLSVLCPQHSDINRLIFQKEYAYHLKIKELVGIMGISLSHKDSYKTQEEQPFKQLLEQVKNK